MVERERVRQDFGSSGDGFASLASAAREALVLLVAQREAGAVLARAQEDVTIEAQGVLSQAEEALIMG